MRKRLGMLAPLFVLLAVVFGRYPWAYWQYRQAQKAWEMRDFVAAQQHLTQYLKVWPQSAPVHLEAARAARKAGAFDEAERLLSRCFDLGGDPESILVEQLLIHVQRGHLADAEPQLVSRVRRNHADCVLILEVLTLAYIQTYQLYNAQECLKHWLEREPDRLEAWLLRAQVFQRLQNHTEALASYRRAAELDPDNDETRLQLAGQLAQSNQLEEALKEFERLRQKQGDTPAILQGLACCRRAMNQPEEARQLLEAVLADHPQNWRALAERGRLAMQFESAADAEKWFHRAVAAAPHEKDALYSLNLCLESQGKHEEAAQVLAELKRIESDLARMADLSRAIAQSPHDPNLRCEAGRVLLRNGLESEALRWLESALVEDPLHAATHQALADYYIRAGDSERAEEHRRLAQGGGAPFAGESKKRGN
ncbi:MAG: tetratricopeptide repeat protein [Gemmataceae bacterium]